VLAAVEIQGAMVDYERQLQGVIERFQMRIGLNSGTVVVGNVGSDLHMEYLAIGDAVNLAARLQSAAQPGKVLISESTARLVGAAVALLPLGEITIKGKSEPVKVFEVGESRGAAESRRGFAELRSPLVGRGAELAALQAALRQLNAGLGGIVVITGEPGIGKSRLIEEACRGPGQLPGVPGSACPGLHWLEGRALSYGQKLSFWTIRQLLQAELGLSDGDPELKMRLALRKRVDALFGEGAEAVLPYLAGLLGVQREGESAERLRILDGETLKYQTLQSITRYFARLAESQPTVLVFDDLHWADPSSLEALENLLPLTDRLPLLLLLISRLEREHPSWQLKLKASSQYAHRFTEIALQPLDPTEQNRLVDNLLTVADLPEPVRARILERAEGNPLFLEEIVRDLIEREALVQDGERWRASGDIHDFAIPETLRGVLLARIDRLHADVRRTLQLASVIGKSFLYRLLEAIGEAEAQLEGHLAQLQRADLVREKARLPELEYTFKHTLAQEAAYHSLLLEQRRLFHRLVGETLEKLFTDRQEEYLGLLAYHFDSAGVDDKAIAYLIQAGDKARLTDEHMEAVGYYQRAVELLAQSGDEQGEAGVWLKLGLVYHANFQFDESYQAYEKAFALKRQVRKAAPPAKISAGPVLRLASPLCLDDCYDPGKVYNLSEGYITALLFSGLAQVDAEMNVVPDGAYSWQVLEGGRRYIFHLRDDVYWSDGLPVKAGDYEWAWKRNLQPAFGSLAAPLLYDVCGAEAFHQGLNADPDSIGIHALDDLTLAVDLVKPAPFFPYIIAMTVCYPVRRDVVKAGGDTWWFPEHIVSNGAFHLVELDAQRSGRMVRNPAYHGDFPGNVTQLAWTGRAERADSLRAYRENRADFTIFVPRELMSDIPAEEVVEIPGLRVSGLLVNPTLPPFDDLGVRRAFFHAVDRTRLAQALNKTLALGGLVPPGMPGHSPDIGLPYEPETARQLLDAAGYPGGEGLPVIKFLVGGTLTQLADQLIAQWRAVFNLEVELVQTFRAFEEDLTYHLGIFGWIADYPDPDNFLRQSNFISFLKRFGWRDAAYDALVESAASLADRSGRMALYRQADRRLTVEQALVIPVEYQFSDDFYLIKPWVKQFRTNLLGRDLINEVIIQSYRPGEIEPVE
jgi:ABC-type oligopeptide transport system substrate-binding subunit